MKWITRERARVDRIACPWLISRFIDPTPEFLFVPLNQVRDASKREGAIPYDIPDVELGHHGPRCSFDAFIDRYELADPALALLAPIVRGADTEDRGLIAGAWPLALFGGAAIVVMQMPPAVRAWPRVAAGRTRAAGDASST